MGAQKVEPFFEADLWVAGGARDGVRRGKRWNLDLFVCWFPFASSDENNAQEHNHRVKPAR